MNNIEKLTLYSLDCIKATSKNSDFVNLQRNKENKIIITNETEFNADNKEVVDIMTIQALNKTTMGIYNGKLMLSGVKGKDKFYAPLLYTEAELVRNGDKIMLVTDENYSVNVGLISCLLDNDSDMVENIINQLLDIDEPEKIDFKQVLSGLINLDGLNIKDEKAVILARIPESIAGLCLELRQIAEYYCK